MKLRSTVNGAVVSVGDSSVKNLVDSGFWVVADEPKPVRKPRVKKTAPVEEPKPEE